jgi:hypothetical protein
MLYAMSSTHKNLKKHTRTLTRKQENGPKHLHVHLHAHAPRLEQQFALWSSLLLEALRTGKDALTAQESLAYDASECFVLVGRDFVTEEHRAGLDLFLH